MKRRLAALLAAAAATAAGCTAGAAAGGTTTVTVGPPGFTPTSAAASLGAVTETVTETVVSERTVTKTAVKTKQVPTTVQQRVEVPTTVVRMSRTTVFAGNGGGYSMCEEPPTRVLERITGVLDQDGINRASGIHAMVRSLAYQNHVYMVAAKFNPGPAVAVWAVDGDDPSWVAPVNATAASLTKNPFGNPPYIDPGASGVAESIICITD